MRIRQLSPAVVCVLLLAGCGEKWHTIGNVDMKNVMTVREAWEKREELKGKIVTVRVDSMEGAGGGGAWVDGREYGCWAIQWEDKSCPKVPQNQIKIHDTVFEGGYNVFLVHSFSHAKPAWFDSPGAMIISEQDFVRNLSRAKSAIVCGYLVNPVREFAPQLIDEKKDPFLESGGYYYENRHLVIMPTGVRSQIVSSR